MAEPIDLGDDDGMIAVTLCGTTAEIDLWHANNVFADVHARNKDRDANAYNEALVQAVETLGFPRVSQRMAQRFAEMIAQRVKQLAGGSNGPAA